MAGSVRGGEARLCLPTGCAGDCDADGAVTVSELVRGVGMVLDQTPIGDCPSFDDNQNGTVSIGELVQAVDRLLEGCDSPPPTRLPSPLVDHFDWEAVAVADDPFASMRPDDATCAPGAFRFEIFQLIDVHFSLEVKTDNCNFLTVSQEVLTPVQKGEEIFIRLAHYALTAPLGGEAYMAVSFGDCIVWEERRRIPSPYGLLTAGFPAPFDIPEKTPVYFHVHNHGANSYHLIEVNVGGSLIEK